jgi:hypothetical protein
VPGLLLIVTGFLFANGEHAIVNRKQFLPGGRALVLIEIQDRLYLL